MSYAAVDHVIQLWRRARGLTLFNEFADQERRFCYSSSPEGECFQISVERPEGSSVTVNAWSVETLDDRELARSWTVQATELESALDQALRQVERWKVRRSQPDRENGR